MSYTCSQSYSGGSVLKQSHQCKTNYKYNVYDDILVKNCLKDWSQSTTCAIFCSMLVSVLLMFYLLATGADPGFLESGFVCIKVWGVRFADFISFFLNIPCK